MDKGNMDVQQAKIIVDELWPYLDSIGLTGMGETFLYDDLEEIVNYIKAKNRGIIISLSTNAVVPNFIEKAKRIVDKVDTIQISIDGVGDTYNSIRKGSSFELLSNNIKELAKICKNTQTTLMLNMVATKENHTDMASLVKFASESEVKYLDFTLFNLAAVSNQEISYYSFYKSPAFISSLNSLEKAIGQHPEVTVTNKNFVTQNSFQKCPFPWTHFYITWDAYMVPCCAKPFPKEMNFGNVRGRKVIDVLNSTQYQKFRKMWFENKSPIFCEKCHFLNIEPVR
jgi:radical SAM protein with 4Fe4S-binding SPASM domain